MLGKRKHSGLFLLCFLLLLISTSTSSYSTAESGNAIAQSRKLESSVRQRIEEIGNDEAITVVIKLLDIDLRCVKSDMVVDALKSHASSSQESVLKFLSEEKGAVVLNTFWLTDIILANITVDTLYKLTGLEAVEGIFENFEVTLPQPLNRSGVSSNGVTWGLDRINATGVWALGFNGSGIRVCVIDTGAEISHIDLQGKMWTDNSSDPTFPGGWIEFDSSGNVVTGSTPHDTDGHGTHTSGTVLGGNASGVDIGVAPGAWLMHGLSLPGGSGSFSQCIASMQWAIDPFDQYGNPAGEKAHVVSMSWGAFGYYDEMIDPVKNMRAAGVIPVASIGNYGEGSSGSPGNVYESFGIGAIDSFDSVASFSSGEVVDWQASHPKPYIKPDFSAPGVSVYSSVPSGGWEYWSGTSMAAPHVAGTVALMLQTNQNMTVDDVHELLKITVDDLGDPDKDFRYGWGVINAYKAVRLALSSCGAEGYVKDVQTLQPLGWTAQVAVLGVSWGSKNTSADGYYRVWLYPGNYSLIASAFGYIGQNATAEVIEQQWTELNFSLTPLPRGFISGVVTDIDTNSTIIGATITLLNTPLAPAVTDAIGYYLLEAPAGAYDVDAWKWGYKPSVAYGTVVLENKTTTVDIQLESTTKVAILGDFRGQATNVLMRGISAHERDWDVIQDIHNYDAIVVNIPSDPGQTTFLNLIQAADEHQVGLVFTNILGRWYYSYGISLLKRYMNDPEGEYDSSWNGRVYYEVNVNHQIFKGWNVGEKIYIIDGGYQNFAWFYRYSGVSIADIGSDQLGPVGCGVAYDVRRSGSVHLLLAGLSEYQYTHVNNAWTDEAKTIFRRGVTWASAPVMQASSNITLSQNSGPTGTKLTVNGSGFAINSRVTVKFDDTPLATAPTDVNGSFLAVFNVPLAEAGVHLVKAFDDYDAYAEATYTVTWVPGGEANFLAVEVDVGSTHFRGEVAEFYALTALNGVPVNVTGISAEIYKPDRIREVLAAERKATGLYLITYDIPATAPKGTYTLKVQADVNDVKGASLCSFLVSPTLTNWNAVLVTIEDNIASIQTDIGMIKMNLTSVEAKFAAVEGDIAVIKTDIGEVKADVAYIRSIIEDINVTLIAVEDGIAILQTDIGQLGVNLTSTNAKINAVQGDVAVIKTDIGEVRTDVAYAKSIIEKSNVTLIAIQGDTAILKTDIGQIRGMITSIQGDVATIETDLGQLKVALSSSGEASRVQQNSDSGLLYMLFFFSGITVMTAIIAIVLLSSSRRAQLYS